MQVAGGETVDSRANLSPLLGRPRKGLINRPTSACCSAGRAGHTRQQTALHVQGAVVRALPTTAGAPAKRPRFRAGTAPCSAFFMESTLPMGQHGRSISHRSIRRVEV
eukprot:353465-Chlamydomonas_euryale.AAC.9